MSDTVPTVRVVNAASKSGFTVINEADFDEKVHTLYVDAPTQAEETKTDPAQTKANDRDAKRAARGAAPAADAPAEGGA